MPRRLWSALILFVGTLGSARGQASLNGDVNITGTAGVFYLDFDVSQPCPRGTTSEPGRALICGNSNSVTLSINGAPPFLLQPGGPAGPMGPSGPPGLTGADGPAGPTGLQGPPGSSAVTDYAVITRASHTAPASNTWALPGAITELFDQVVRVQADLTTSTCARVYTQIGENYGPPGAVVFFQYSSDGGTNWYRLTQDASLTSSGAHVSLWWAIPNAAKSDVLLRAVSSNGINTNVDIEAVHLQVNACENTSAYRPSQSRMRIAAGRPRFTPAGRGEVK
jgi:hypothetical protein